MGVNLEQLIRDSGVPIAPDRHHHSRSGWLNFDCVYCGKGSYKYHMGYNLNQHNVNCWACGRQSLYDVMYKLLGNEWDAIKGSVSLPKRRRVRPGVGGTCKPPKGLCGLTDAHRDYLTGRGFDPDRLQQLWSIDGRGGPGQPWGIWIPIYLNGEMVSWTSRSLTDDGLRYRSADRADEAAHHKDVVYGADYVRGVGIVHEGPTDVWATGPGSVCTFGLEYSDAQLSIIANWAIRYVCFDNSPTAQARARKLCAALAGYPGQTHNIRLDTGSDPATADDDEKSELRKLLAV